jgi:hypothetical protein
MSKKNDSKENFQEHVAAQLKALGASFSYQSPKNLVFDTLVNLWKTKKDGPPTFNDIYTALSKYNRDTIRKYLLDMKNDKILLNPIRGVWVPIMQINGIKVNRKFYSKSGDVE